MLVDHGSVPSGYYLEKRGLSVIFAGKSMKADDVIVRDVPFCQNTLGRDVVVVTADTELIQRCKSAANRSGGKMLSIINPLFFLADFEKIVDQSLEESISSMSEEEDESETPEERQADDDLTSGMEKEITQGARLIAVETQLRNRGKKNKNLSPSKFSSFCDICTDPLNILHVPTCALISHTRIIPLDVSEKRKKLMKQAQKIRAKLGLSGPSTLNQVTSVMLNGGLMGDSLNTSQQKELLKKWKSLREESGRREQTGDRILLAEGLRRELETLVGPYSSHSNHKLNFMSPSESHACYANALIHDVLDDSKKAAAVSDKSSSLPHSILDEKDNLRLVVVSDTHGCERSLTDDVFEPWLFTAKDCEEVKDGDALGMNDNTQLPDGDILLHLGDFAIDRGGIARRNALDRFDKWMSLQSHPIKIVVRGNHDPYNAQFPLSKAEYITEPTTMSFGKKTMAIIPYGYGGFSTSKSRRSQSTSLLPSTCDILATHEPPQNILDRCLSGERAGSGTIRTAVENMKGPPPKLWICGHIHEGRGAVRTTFGTKHDTRETLVINAANANPGRANHLVYGPTIIDISDGVGIVDSGDSKPVARTNPLKPQRREKREGEQELVLAVDLGLRCGASLFDDTGKLLRYEQLRFKDPEDLYAQAPLLIDSWGSEINSQKIEDLGEPVKKKVISYLAVEGGGELFDAWETALDSDENKGIQLVSVRPEEWRSHLLSLKERESSRSCKEAARLIARQIVSDFGTMESHKGKFKTDAAESVAMGYYFANHLGWIQREPIVSRYTNGKIIVPK
jgi:Icc-related predicted phosphoesterase